MTERLVPRGLGRRQWLSKGVVERVLAYDFCHADLRNECPRGWCPEWHAHEFAECEEIGEDIVRLYISECLIEKLAWRVGMCRAQVLYDRCPAKKECPHAHPRTRFQADVWKRRLQGHGKRNGKPQGKNSSAASASADAVVSANPFAALASLPEDV